MKVMAFGAAVLAMAGSVIPTVSANRDMDASDLAFHMYMSRVLDGYRGPSRFDSEPSYESPLDGYRGSSRLDSGPSYGSHYESSYGGLPPCDEEPVAAPEPAHTHALVFHYVLANPEAPHEEPQTIDRSVLHFTNPKIETILHMLGMDMASRDIPAPHGFELGCAEYGGCDQVDDFSRFTDPMYPIRVLIRAHSHY